MITGSESYQHEKQPNGNGKVMSNLTKQQMQQLEKLNQLPDDQIDTSDIPEVTDWAGAVRGRFYQGKATVQLDQDVAAHFKDSKSVNQALRMLIQLANTELPETRTGSAAH